MTIDVGGNCTSSTLGGKRSPDSFSISRAVESRDVSTSATEATFVPAGIESCAMSPLEAIFERGESMSYVGAEYEWSLVLGRGKRLGAQSDKCERGRRGLY